MPDNLIIEKRNTVAIVTLNRPEVRNAFDDVLIAELTKAFREIERDDSVRVMVLRPWARSAEVLSLYDSDFGVAKTERIHAHLATLAQELGLDMIVVVCRNVDIDRATKTNQKLRGYGLQKAVDSAAFAYASIYVEAYDTRKFFVVGKATGFQSQQLPDGIWQTAFETAKGKVALPVEIQEVVSKVLRKVVGDAVAIAAQEAGV